MKCYECGKEFPQEIEVTCGGCGNVFNFIGDEIVCPNCGRRIEKLRCSECIASKSEKEKKTDRNYLKIVVVVVFIIISIGIKFGKYIEWDEIFPIDFFSGIDVEYEEVIRSFEILEFEAEEKTESWYDENDRCIEIKGRIKALEDSLPKYLEVVIYNEYGKVREVLIEIPRIYKGDKYTIDERIHLEDCSDAEFTKIAIDMFLR